MKLTDKFELFMRESFPVLTKAEEAIYEVTGITLEQMRSKRRLAEYVYARVIFWNLCYKEVQSNTYLSSYLNRTHATGCSYGGNYIDNHEYDFIFQNMLKEVTNVFNSK
jgi:hypothetical protein